MSVRSVNVSPSRSTPRGNVGWGSGPPKGNARRRNASSSRTVALIGFMSHLLDKGERVERGLVVGGVVGKGGNRAGRRAGGHAGRGGRPGHRGIDGEADHGAGSSR